jgi:acyl-homoserine lactone acylase PvdQ
LAEVNTPYARFFSGWNGSMDTALVAPTLFYNFKINLVKTLTRHLGSSLMLPPSEQHIFNSVALDDSLPVAKGWVASTQLVQEAWDSCVTQLQERFGKDAAAWTYGKFHQTNIQHLLRLPQLAMPLFASNGNNRTVNVASRLPSTHAASMRTIIELRPEGPRAALMLTGGQSGRFNSSHYSDQVYHWLSGGYHEADLSKSFVASRYATTIRFNR